MKFTFLDWLLFHLATAAVMTAVIAGLVMLP